MISKLIFCHTFSTIFGLNRLKKKSSTNTVKLFKTPVFCVVWTSDFFNMPIFWSLKYKRWTYWSQLLLSEKKLTTFKRSWKKSCKNLTIVFVVLLKVIKNVIMRALSKILRKIQFLWSDSSLENILKKSNFDWRMLQKFGYL